jgi:hypothetical protein
MFAAAAYAFWRGGRPEQIYSILLIAGSFATRFTQSSNLANPQYGILAVDVCFFAAVVILALKCDRWWVLFAAAFQLVDLTTHAARIVDPSLHGLAYLRGLAIWGYLSLAALVVGVWLHARQTRPALAG